MRLEIVSGQANVNVEKKFQEILNQNNVFPNNVNSNIWRWPEREPHHPQVLYELVKKTVKYNIENNIDLFILTYSELVLYAIRVEIGKHCFSGGKVHQFTEDGMDTCADILPCGKLNKWEDGVFDTTDNALTELLDTM